MVSGPHDYYLVARGGSRGPCCGGCPKRGAEFLSSYLGHHKICLLKYIFICRVHIRKVERVEEKIGGSASPLTPGNGVGRFAM